MAVTRPSGPPAPAASTRRRFRDDIQGLRAVAVVLVIANHAGIPGFAGGYIGVDVFFVISGYVITQLLLREADKGPRQGLADFYSRRVRRIVPAASATLVVTVIAAEMVTGGRVGDALIGDVRWAAAFLANFRLIRTGSNYFVPGLQPSLITQFWSLAVEEQFYLCFPLAVFLVAKFAPRERRRAALSAVLLVGILLSAWWSVHLSSANPPAAYYSPFTRFWELGLGCLLATVTARAPGPRDDAARLLTAAGVVLLVVALVVLGPRSVYPGALAWLPCLSTALLIWAGARPAAQPYSRVTAFLSTRPMVVIGDLSYSLYLWHFIWLKLPAQLSPPLGGASWRIVELVGTFVTAFLSYHLLENPIRRSRRLANDRVAVAMLLCVCVAASWAAAGVMAHHTQVG